MKKLILILIALNFTAGLISSSQAQQACEECTMKPAAIGIGGLTCEKAADAFQKGTGSRDALATEYAGSTTYTLASEVYCYRGFGNPMPGGSPMKLTFHSTEIEDVLSGGYSMSVTADLQNIMGNLYLDSVNNITTFTSTHGDACFSRYQLVRDGWGNWRNSFQPHYFNYQCRIPQTNSEALICKVKYDGRIDIGYQVYKMDGVSGEILEGVLE